MIVTYAVANEERNDLDAIQNRDGVNLDGLKINETKVMEPNSTFEVVPLATFTGDGCPTGKVKINGICVDKD
ncbi:hypothetical protein KGM_202583 [Danaus plexippus plexippus]|uniref:Uncharacterized protein n=1 Tax=Danaus plexippus plexippus TaxID=278856 RepID=A0A212EZ06_DANPL|nr:hypothetical protein KGM_202583 [Danaus plexippus plexippus]